MRLSYDDAAESFRAELAAWLQEHAPSQAEMDTEPRESTAKLPSWAKRFQRAMFDDGWLVPGWSPELGGRDASPVEQMIYFEELAARDVQRSLNPQGLSIVTPSIVEHGTPEQIERFALPTLRAEITFCVGMSEPGAGSDLAALATRAVLRGDKFVLNGQKVWTSGAHDADYGLVFVRTNTGVPKHKGISVLIVDMTTAGIECRPLEEATEQGHADFNEVFFTDAEVPAENLLGELDGGWALATSSLGHERAMLWINQATNMQRALAALAKAADLDDPLVRDRLGQLAIDVQAMWLMGYRSFARQAAGKSAPEQSILKLYGSETEQHLYLEAVETLGTAALDTANLSGVRHARELSWPQNYLRSFGNTIAGGASEIQRNIIAERVLGLPR